MFEWLNNPAPFYVVIIALCWIVLSGVSTMYLIDGTYSKNPFKNMWMSFDEAHYNLAGKIILCIANAILGAPCAIFYYLCTLIGFGVQKLVGLFNLIFKEKK